MRIVKVSLFIFYIYHKMDTLQAIKTRRSVRIYIPEPLDQKGIEDIVKYAYYAPSAHNQQAWKYFLVSKLEDHMFLADTMEYGKMLADAPCVLLACYDKSLLRSSEFIQQDMGASIQTLLLAGHAQWFWAVRVGLYPHEVEMQKIHQHFQLPESIVPFALIAMGKSAEIPVEKRIKPENFLQIL